MCAHCGTQFEYEARPGRQRRFCSRNCDYLDRRTRAPKCSYAGCDSPVQARGLCGSHYSAWHRSKTKYTITCGHCGRTVQVDRPTRKHCSTKCAAAHGGKVSIKVCRKPRPLVLYTGPVTPRDAPVTIIKSQHRLVSGQCIICTAWFISYFTDITCSERCQQRHAHNVRRLAKERRRALERDAFIENINREEVFEHDGYRCHLCRRKTDTTKQTPHPRAPTIDHIIPLAQGGKHEQSNCRTACFLCNARKGDRGGGEQLLLIA